MDKLSDIQLQAITVMQAAEEHIDNTIEEVASQFSIDQYEKAALLGALRGLIEVSIKYGQLKSTHERLLKDVTKI